MAKDTRAKIIEAAEKLFYRDGIRGVSVDAVAEAAGVTKRTLYYHFTSKDELIAAYLYHRDQPNLARMRGWFEAADGSVSERTRAIFQHLAKLMDHPSWRGCGFLRTAAELANMPGHPAIAIGRAHKLRFEDWLAGFYAQAGIIEAGQLARQIVLLVDGVHASGLLHRDKAFALTAGEAAHALVETALAKNIAN